MKKLVFLSVLTLGACGLFAADGATLFKKCATCHGAKAEKVYLNKVPALNTLTAETRLEAMKAYKAGTRNEFKMGAIMKIQVAKLSEEDMKAIEEYIESLKK